jgi:Secretion system C-terminal sorting domain
MRIFAWFVVCVLCIPGLLLASIPDSAGLIGGNHTVYWSEDWEDGMGLWSASNGVWEVGAPSYGTSECFGSRCAATKLDGQYPYNSNTRLESVSIDLPESLADGVLWLGLWHWFNNSASYGTDYGSIQIWTEEEGWVEASHHYVRNSQVWAPFYLDITDYAGQTVKIGFFFNDEQVSNYPAYQGPGWCVDQIKIFDGQFPELGKTNRFDQCVDMDWDGWYPDQGVWELGEPASGISAAYSSRRCFGTNLSGNYPYGVYSRLISPQMTLSAFPLDNQLYFSFKQYCSLSGSYGTDQGILQINDGTGWVTLYTDNWHNNLGAKWVERVYDISSYSGQTVQFGFVIDDNQQSNYPAYQSHGWYIDDIQFSEGALYNGNPERFENFAPNWHSTVGLWEVGEPTSGPGEAYSGTNCWGTVLDGNYPYGAYDRLYTPPIALDNTAGLYLRFQHWYSFSGSYGVDFGVVRILPEGGEWTDISGHFSGSSGGWTQWSFDLSDYIGQTVQFGFRIDDEQQSNYPDRQSSGWYIDDFEIVGMTQGEAPADPIFLDVSISAGPGELSFFQFGTNIEKVVIYGSSVEDFKPTLGTRLAILPGDATSWTDTEHPGWPANYYRVSIVDNLGNESVPILATNISPVQDGDQTPTAGLLSLKGAVPNPFNPSTYINFTLPRAGMVDIEVFDLSGRKVADLFHNELEVGPHKVLFSPENLASGTYFARVSSGGQMQTKKMVLLK